MPRKYNEETLDKAEALRAKGVSWQTIHATLGEHLSHALAQRRRRAEKPTPSTVDVLYPASYYRERGLPSPYDNQ